MLGPLTPYSVALLASAAICAGIALYAWARRDHPGASGLAGLAVTLTVWSGAYAMELTDSSLEVKLFWAGVQYLGIVLVGPAWVAFAASYAIGRGAVTRGRMAALLAVPIATIATAWTNGDHQLMWTGASVFQRGALSVLVFDHGWLYALHITYSYLLLLTASLLLLRCMVRLPAFDRQAVALLIAVSAPWLGNLLHVTQLSPVYPLDLTPFSFSISGLAITISMRRFGLLDLVPVARATVLESMRDGVVVLDASGRVVDLNPAAAQMLGSERGALLARDAATVLPDSQELRSAIAAEVEADVPLPYGEGETKRHYDFHVSPLTRDDGTASGQLLVIHDVTDLVTAEERIRYLALRDPVTDLPNRQMLTQRFELALKSAHGADRHVACLFFDLDDFKKVNDHYGHSAGDELLAQAAKRVRGVLRPGDTVTHVCWQEHERTLARFGGDEFVVLLEGLSQPDDATIPAERIVAALREPFALADSRVTLTTSIGIAVSPADGTGVERLLRNADAAMYEAKRHGGDRYQFFTEQIDYEVRKRAEVESQLHQALDAGQFELMFQPQAHVRSGRLATFEALVRWRHPERGVVGPEEFMDIAENSGLIGQLDAFVVDRACHVWHGMFPDVSLAPRLAINLSPRRFRERDIVGVVAAALENSGLPPRQLELELTESALMEDSSSTRKTLRALRELGVRLAVDDFGTGYSSLGYLQSFDLDVLKIDRLFTHRVCDDERAANLVHAIVAMGHTLGLSVVAEGIEDARQAERLLRAGCDRLQGFAVGRPADAEGVLRLLGRRAERQAA